jgi:2-polyprenyl-6-hydroxyphenyl methylase / 3-demethylubiquinone-9 3-methyltransferase
MYGNFDAQELAKFDALAAHWWDSTGELKTLHQINPLRLQYISDHVPLAGKTVLDIGCGGGILSESMAQQGALVTAIDLNPSLIQVAKLHLLESNVSVNYEVISAEQHAETRPQHYDVITCMELLEHVPDPSSIIAACSKMIKSDGHLFFSTINRNPKSYLQAIIAAEYILKLLPKHTHRFRDFIKPSELCDWLRSYELKPSDIKGISYHLRTQSYTITNDIAVNYLLYARKTL